MPIDHISSGVIVITPGHTQPTSRAIEEHYEQLETVREILREIPKLPAREAVVIVLYFGLDGGPRWTLSKIADLFQMSTTRVAALKKRALERLEAKARQYQDGAGNTVRWTFRDYPGLYVDPALIQKRRK